MQRGCTMRPDSVTVQIVIADAARRYGLVRRRTAGEAGRRQPHEDLEQREEEPCSTAGSAGGR
jgi:hypothetical protein